jgi:hypothetical protein
MILPKENVNLILSRTAFLSCERDRHSLDYNLNNIHFIPVQTIRRFPCFYATCCSLYLSINSVEIVGL